jgi:hypothetical protein
MLSGFRGHLISSAFVEESLLASGGGALATVHQFRDRLSEWRRSYASLGPASSLRTLLDAGAAPLLAALGFGAPAAIEVTSDHASAVLAQERGRAALLVTSWAAPLDPFWRTAVTHAIHCGADWCFVFNGTSLRIVDASRLYARRSVEFEIECLYHDERASAALRHIGAAAAVPRGAAQSLHAIVAASDRHAASVSRSLKDGVLAAAADLLAALVARRAPPAGGLDDAFEQALTIVYRVLFLLFAEARLLVPLWHPVYRRSYSIETLGACAGLPGPGNGFWDALRAIARLAHAGCHAGDLRVTPFDGRLFSPERTPLAERRGLDDEAARRALIALSTRPAADRAGRQRIMYRDLGVEQLGAVYETLLDYRPRLASSERSAAGDGRARRPRPGVTLESGSGTRKATGTFYTPQPIADYLVRRTLGPLVAEATPERILGLRIVDPAMGSGAFLVAACRYLASAYETALIVRGDCHPGDLGDRERAAIRRTIAERCLYGVDLNPMAVQLARLSLWLATLAAERPLTFLDHRLQIGDSLLGAWLANVRRAPDPRRRAGAAGHALPLFDVEPAREALRAALPIRFSLESTPTDTIDQARAKERALAAISARGTAVTRWKRIADAWCASWFDAAAIPASAFSALADAILGGSGALPMRTVERMLAAAGSVRSRRRFFHWELEFPEVFFDADGGRLRNSGFDAVVGNPPWDMIRADTGSAGERARSRADAAAVVSFSRGSGIYQSQSDGHSNRYQLFVERAIDLTKAGGRIGLVLPSGLATDHGSAALRRELLTRTDVDAIVGVENHRGVFPIHRSVRFLLVTASKGSPTSEIACRLGIDNPADLEWAGEPAQSREWFPVRLTPALVERLSGPDLTIPAFRSAIDVAINERAASLFAPLGSAAGWAASFGRELNATDDRDAFKPAGFTPAGHRASGGVRWRRRQDTRLLPVVEGKHLAPFRVNLDLVARVVSAEDAHRRLPLERYLRPRLAYRDVASATNRTTLIAAILPGGCVSTHTVFCLRPALPLEAQHGLCGLFNSLVVNYLVRLRVSTHVTTAIVERLPVPIPEQAPAAFRELAALARLLARRFDPAAFARLNAVVARLYQLTPAEFRHVLGTFPLVPREERNDALHFLDLHRL